MMRDIQLVGYVADLPGTDQHLVEADPVVRIDANLFVARGYDWQLSNLVALTEADERFVNFIREPDQRVIDEGSSVWIVGKELFFDIRNVSGLREVGLKLGSWNLAPRGFRWSSGTHRAFQELSNGLFFAAERALRGYLFDAHAKSHGYAEAAYKVVTVLSGVDPRRQYLNRALYFREVRDEYSLEFVIEEATMSSAFSSRDEFVQTLDGLRDELLEERLSETDSASPESVAHSPSDFRNQIVRFEYLKRLRAQLNSGGSVRGLSESAHFIVSAREVPFGSPDVVEDNFTL